MKDVISLMRWDNQILIGSLYSIWTQYSNVPNKCTLDKITFLQESQYSLHILNREKFQFCNHSWSLESFHTLRIFVWKFNFHHVFFPKTRWMAWRYLNFHTKTLRVWKDSKLQEWLQNWSFSLINMWSEYWLS